MYNYNIFFCDNKECRYFEDYPDTSEPTTYKTNLSNVLNGHILTVLPPHIEMRLKMRCSTAKKVAVACKQYVQDHNLPTMKRRLKDLADAKELGKYYVDDEPGMVDVIFQGVELGKGTTHQIYEGYSLRQGQFVAIRQIKEFKRDNNNLLMDILKQGEHCKQIYQIYKVFAFNHESISIEKLYSRGTLNQFIASKFSFNPLKIAKSLIKGLDFLHRNIKIRNVNRDRNIPFSHRDIKPDNILFDSKGRAVIGDLNVLQPLQGTPLFMSPDKLKLSFELDRYGEQKKALGQPFILEDKKIIKKIVIFEELHCHAADIWALGLVFAATFAKHSDPNSTAFYRVINSSTIAHDGLDSIRKTDVLNEIERLSESLSEKKHQDFVSFVLPKMLELDPQQRIGIFNLKEMVTRFNKI